MIKRLQIFIENLHISVRAFEIQIGASDGMIRRAINNKTDIQSKWIASIAENYPHLRMEWLIAGRGEMLRLTDNEELDSQKIEPTIIYRDNPDKDEIIQLLRDKVKLLEQNARQTNPQLGFYAPKHSSEPPVAESPALIAFPTINNPRKG